MFHSITFNNHMRQVMKRLAILVVLLPSINVFADKLDTPVNETMQVNSMNDQASIPKAVDPYEAIKRKKSPNKQSANSRPSGNSRPSSSERVFKDDYERLLRQVAQPRATKMIWLGQKKSS